jgi:MFS family permease
VRLRATTLGYLAAGAIAAGEGGLGVMLPPYLTVLGFPVPAIGAFVAFYAVAGLLSRLPGGRFYRQGWIRPLIGLSLLLQCCANLAYPWFSDWPTLAVLRLLGGFSYGLCTTINLAQFIDGLPPRARRDRPMALYTAALSVGFALGNITSGFVASAFGYTAGFTVVAMFPLAVAIATLFAEEPTTLRVARAGRAGPRALVQAMGEPLLFVVLLESFLLNFLFGLHYALFPLYLLSIGASLAAMGLIRGLFSTMQVASRISTGWLIGRLGHRRLAVVGIVGQVIAIALLPFTTNLLLLAALSLAYGLWRGMSLVANTLGMAESSDRAVVSRGASSGLFNAASDVGVLLGPLIAGATAGVIGIGGALIVMPLAALVMHTAALALNARRPQPAARVAD